MDFNYDSENIIIKLLMNDKTQYINLPSNINRNNERNTVITKIKEAKKDIVSLT